MRRQFLARLAIGGVAAGSVALALGLSGLPGEMARALGALRDLDPEAVALAILLCLVSTLINGAIWSRLLLRLGHDVPWRTGLAAYLSAGLAGYLVNAAGPAVGCALSMRRHGVSPARAVLLTLLGNALGLCGVLVWAPLGLLLLARAGMAPVLPLVGKHGIAVAVVGLIGLTLGMLLVLNALALAPVACKGLSRRLLGKHGDCLSGEPLRLRHLLALVPWTATAWLINVLSLYAVLSAVSPAADLNLGDIVGSAALAATLGSLAFFVPDGMGVRDGALVALLAHSTGLSVAECAAAAIVVRALDPVSKLGTLCLVVACPRLGLPGPIVRLRALLWARWSQRPGHPGLLLPWYLWRAAFSAGRE